MNAQVTRSRSLFFVLCAFVIGLSIAPAAYAASPRTVLPPASAVKGWKMTSGIRMYNSSNLFNLIDGEAQAVLGYSFAGCAHAEYAPAKQSRPAITIDVYDMSDPLDAYGLFGSDRISGPSIKIGAEGVRIGQTALDFWKGAFVVRCTIVAIRRSAVNMGKVSPENSVALLTYARAAAARITGAVEIPASVHALPAGYRANSQGYIRTNVAGHSFLKNAVTATYPSAGFGAELFICMLPSPSAAKQTLGVYERYEKGNAGIKSLKGIGQGGFQVNDRFQKTVVVAQKGRYLVGVVRAKAAPEAVKLIREALARLH